MDDSDHPRIEQVMNMAIPMNSKMKMIYRCLLICVALTFTQSLRGQYSVKGSIENPESSTGYNAYLSIIRNWDDFQNINSFDVIKKSELDSSGTFAFSGNELPDEQAFYRVHFAPSDNPTLILGYPKNYFSFILSNTDSIELTIKSQLLATIIKVTSTIEENESLVPLSTVLDSLKIQVFELSNFSTDDSNGKIIKERQNTDESYKANQIKLLEDKKEVFLLNAIQQSDDQLIQMYCAYYARLNYEDHPLIFDTIAKDLNDSKYINSYYTSMSDYILSNSYETIILKYRRSKAIIIVLSVTMVLLILYLIFTAQKRSLGKTKLSNSEQLTSKEIQVSKLISGHKSNKEIADELFISVATVKTHVNNIYRKLGVKSRQELIQSNKP